MCLISGSNEYQSNISLPGFKQYLETQYSLQCTLIQARGKLNQFGEYSELPGLESIDHSDVVILFTRRLTLPEEQLNKIRETIDSGKPVVAIRTASHGFQGWPEFDKIVLGGNYHGHFGTEFKQTLISVTAFQNHPVLKGVDKIISTSSLYKTSPVAADADVLMISSTHESTQPAAWTRIHHGGRIFYTSLGSPEDFQDPSFRQLLINAIFWTSGREAGPRCQGESNPQK